MITKSSFILNFFFLLLLVTSNMQSASTTHQYETCSNIPTIYPWKDISSSGTTLTLADDDTSPAISLGADFNFNFANTNYTQVRISSNGWISFANPTVSYTNSSLPSGKGPILMPFWDDLNPNSVATRIRYQILGTSPNRVFVISFLNVPRYCSGGTSCTGIESKSPYLYTFQTQLHESSNEIIYSYQSMGTLGGPFSYSSNNDAGATIGIEASNTNYLQYSYNTNSITNGKAIRFYGTSGISKCSTYAVTYNGNGNTGGTVPVDSLSPYYSGSNVTILGNTSNLTRIGYIFAGWNTASDGSGTMYQPGNSIPNIAANITLYAQWTAPNLTTCWIEPFTDSSLVGKWNVSGTGYTPEVTAGRLRLTPASGYIATLATLSGELPANDNIIEIEFDQFAYSGSGADGMTLTLSNAAITPITGASGGSLGYAQKIGVNGFSGGWLGFGIDEFGNFSACTEGRQGGETVSDSSCNDKEIDSFAIRGSGSGTTGYDYITGTTTLTPQIDNNSNGHQYKLSIDTRFNQTWVKVERKTSSSGSYIEIIPWYNATQSATAPQNFRLSLTASTGGSTNIHEADNFNLKALSCGTIGVPVPVNNFSFDAWDSFRSISDRNISTKIVNKPFTLTVAALNEANTAFQDFNGTVCAKIINNVDQNISGWNKLLFSDQNSSSTTFTINRAIGGSDSARVKLYWKKNVDTTCPITAEDNSTIASDRFAVRPASFGLFTTNAVAGTDFYVDFIGYNYNGSASADYNETSGGTFDVSTAEHNAACPLGTFTIPLTPFSFQDGIKSIMTRYSDVGIIDINITDLTKPCTSRFAKIDCDDLNVSDGTNYTANLIPIGLEEGTITIIPHHFDVNAALSNFSGGTFTYLSDDLNMSAQLDLNITAKNGEGNTTTNYSSACYAKNTNLTLDHSTVPSPLTKILYTETLSTLNTTVLKDDSWVLSLNSTLFNSGSVAPNIDFNFDRSPTKPLNPFDFNITSATAADVDITGSTTPLGDTKFVYGRVHAYDITTNTSPVNAPIEFEVYSTLSSGFVSGMPQNVLKWYRNLDHDTAAHGNVISGGFNAGATDSAIDTSTDLTNPANGLQLIKVTSINDQTVHLKISPWLWYSLNPLKTYNYGTDCTQHPCFHYDFTDTTTGVQGVNSGTFQGSDFQMAPAKNITNKGVKIFR